MLSPDELKELKQVLKKYPDSRSAVIPALYIAQRAKNSLDGEDIQGVAEVLDLPVTEVQAGGGLLYLVPQTADG